MTKPLTPHPDPGLRRCPGCQQLVTTTAAGDAILWTPMGAPHDCAKARAEWARVEREYLGRDTTTPALGDEPAAGAMPLDQIQEMPCESTASTL